ncbi:hypothetical protein IKE87_00640 [Candidatus Saccharibacteria bacterium]|nr:hypothetical protein [Candidatus Saccharibacteria bacterium]
MRPKTKTRIGVVVSLALLLTIWGTVAYYVAIETAHNAISTGGVDIALFELTDEYDEEGNPKYFTDIGNARPGETYSKIPYVENLDTGSAWVRSVLKVTVTTADGVVHEIDDWSSLINIDFDDENWTLNGGYYYYRAALAAGAKTEPMFRSVTIREDWPAEYLNSTLTLKIDTEAVQSANNGSSATEATGWGTGGEI